MSVIVRLFLVLAAAQSCCLFTRGSFARERLTVNTDFEAGSGEFQVDQENRSIRLQPSRHNNRGWDCWWYIQVSGLEPGETFAVDVGNAPWATPDRAAISDDNKKWQQSMPGTREGNRIVYRVPATSKTMWIAWGPPFTSGDAESLVKSCATKCKNAEAFELCRSRLDRPVWAIRFAPPQKEAPPKETYGIWVHARQHAWECGSSWVAAGLLRWLQSDDERALRLRDAATITVVPVMDVDNVAIGAGGKNESPQDHNRDWTDAPFHPAVAAAQAKITEANKAGSLHLFVDLHNPGANAKNPFFYTSPRSLLTERGIRNLDNFLAAAQADINGPLAFRGEVQESGEKYDKNWKAISKNWVAMHANDHVVSVTLETAWNTPASTTEGYQLVGEQLGLAMERYFRAAPR